MGDVRPPFSIPAIFRYLKAITKKVRRSKYKYRSISGSRDKQEENLSLYRRLCMEYFHSLGVCIHSDGMTLPLDLYYVYVIVKLIQIIVPSPMRLAINNVQKSKNLPQNLSLKHSKRPLIVYCHHPSFH